MTLRLTEEEYAELMRRRGKTSSVSPLRGDPPVHGPAGPVSLESVHWTDSRALDAPSGEGLGKRGKYGNRKVTVDGMKFDSQHEADYYSSVLWPRWMAGELVLLARQVPFDLPGGIRYIADFVTVDTAGRVEVIDAKSAITKKNRTYINKRKQMKAVWRIEILEV